MAETPDVSTDTAATATLVEVLYVDAANNKQAAVVVFAGVMTEQEQAALRANLHAGEFFLPAQVGLPVLYSQWGAAWDDDHIWHQIRSIETGQWQPTDPRTASQFAAEFAATTWDETAANADLEQWMADNPRLETDD